MTANSGALALEWSSVRPYDRRAVPAQSKARTASDAAMDRYAAGDDSAFEELYDTLADRLHAYIRRYVTGSHDCDDILQETFLRMHKARGAFIAGAAVVPWAFAIARRLVLDRARRDGRTPSSVTDLDVDVLAASDRTDEIVDAREAARRLTRAFARMPDSQRAAFELLKQDGLTLAEAAEVLGVSVTAVKLRAHRAYQSIRAALGEEV
jgi:RNA polymerase sigma-70 factor (ECF subfamily)